MRVDILMFEVLGWVGVQFVQFKDAYLPVHLEPGTAVRVWMQIYVNGRGKENNKL